MFSQSETTIGHKHHFKSQMYLKSYSDVDRGDGVVLLNEAME